MKWIRIFTFIAWTPGAAMLASGCAQPDRPSPGQARAQRAAGEVADPVGATLDSFAFSTLDGRPLAWDATTQTLDAPGGGVKPRLLAVHVFQPDCNACQEQARSLQRLHVKGAADSIAVVGITHRGDAAAAREFVRKFGVTYPIAAATGTDWAGRWGRGDPMFLVGNDGKIVYSQEGYQPTDLDIWWAVAADVRDGRVVAFRHPQRSGEKLTTGDVLPAIELPDLMTGRALALRVDDGKLAFVDGDGRSHPCRASIGFFSRYWAFSREEMVHLQKMHDRYAARGLFVYAIAMHDDDEAARRLNREMGITYPVFQGKGSKLGDRFAYGWPAYITDAGGVIRYTQLGFEAGDAVIYEKQVRSLLETK